MLALRPSSRSTLGLIASLRWPADDGASVLERVYALHSACFCAQPYALCICVHARQSALHTEDDSTIAPERPTLWLVCLSKHLSTLSLSLLLGFISEYSYSLDITHTYAIDNPLFLFELSTKRLCYRRSPPLTCTLSLSTSQSRSDALLVFIDVEFDGVLSKTRLGGCQSPKPNLSYHTFLATFDCRIYHSHHLLC